LLETIDHDDDEHDDYDDDDDDHDDDDYANGCRRCPWLCHTMVVFVVTPW
jgi:hypothetical protein